MGFGLRLVKRSAAGATAFLVLGALASSPLAAAAAGPQRVEIAATEFSFTPSTVTLTAGQPVQLVLHNTGKLDHDLKSALPLANLTYQKAGNPADEQKDNSKDGSLDVDVNVGDTSTVTFTPTQAGSYSFNCDVDGHEAAGMKGSFVVQAAAGQ